MAIHTLLTNPFRPFQDTGISESIGRGLEALTQHKMHQMQQQKTASALQSLGISPQLAALDPRILQQVVHQKLQEPSQMAFAQGLQALLGGSQPQQMNGAPQSIPSRQQISEGELLGQKIFGTSPTPSSEGERLGRAIFGNNPPITAHQSMQQNQQNPQRQQPPIPAGLNAQQANQLAQLGLKKQIAERKENKKEQQLAKQESIKLQEQADRETLPYYQEMLKEDKSAKKIDLLTGRMEKLIEKGVPNPLFYKTFKDLEDSVNPLYAGGAGAAAGLKLGGIGGAVLGGLLGLGLKPLITAARYGQMKLNPTAEEFEKLSAEFISGAKAIFGSRITDADLRAFMLTVPQLSNTKAGKESIIRNIQLMNKAVHLRSDAMKEIIKENKGHRPIDLAIQVEERIAPTLDKLAQEFIS